MRGVEVLEEQPGARVTSAAAFAAASAGTTTRDGDAAASAPTKRMCDV